MRRTFDRFRLLVGSTVGWSNRQQRDAIAHLSEENRVLREQLGGKRLRLNDDQRRSLAAKAKMLGRRILRREIATIVRPVCATEPDQTLTKKRLRPRLRARHRTDHTPVRSYFLNYQRAIQESPESGCTLTVSGELLDHTISANRFSRQRRALLQPRPANEKIVKRTQILFFFQPNRQGPVPPSQHSESGALAPEPSLPQCRLALRKQELPNEPKITLSFHHNRQGAVPAFQHSESGALTPEPSLPQCRLALRKRELPNEPKITLSFHHNRQGAVPASQHSESGALAPEPALPQCSLALRTRELPNEPKITLSLHHNLQGAVPASQHSKSGALAPEPALPQYRDRNSDWATPKKRLSTGWILP